MHFEKEKKPRSQNPAASQQHLNSTLVFLVAAAMPSAYRFLDLHLDLDLDVDLDLDYTPLQHLTAQAKKKKKKSSEFSLKNPSSPQSPLGLYNQKNKRCPYISVVYVSKVNSV